MTDLPRQHSENETCMVVITFTFKIFFIMIIFSDVYTILILLPTGFV